MRRKAKHQDIIQEAQCLDAHKNTLFTHSVPVVTEDKRRHTDAARWCGGREPPLDFSATDRAYDDGALKGVGPIRARRGAWAWVVVDNDSQVIAGMYGTTGDRSPSSFRVKLKAVVEILWHAMPPLAIHVGSKGVIEGWQKGVCILLICY